MNVIEILWKLGWDVLSFNEDGEYRISLSSARRERIFEAEKNGLISYEGTGYEIYTVKVGEVSFNGIGDLFVKFIDVESGEIIDCYEHKNMSKYEIFD